MARFSLSQTRLGTVLVLVSLFLSGCESSANSRYWGKTTAPTDKILRYVSGSEPESLDPQIPSGQPEARIAAALFEGLVEYHPKTLEAIPAIAESWESSPNVDEFIFHIRKNAKWSDGKLITAHDFVYSMRRGFAPETVSRTAPLGYFIKYAEAFNGHQLFVERNGKFITNDDVAEKPAEAKVLPPFGAETEFHKFLNAPARLTVDSDVLKRARSIEPNPKLKEIFKFAPVDFKNASSLANKIKNGGDELSKYLSQNFTPAAFVCADEAACSDAAKQALADNLNKIADTDSMFMQEWFAQINLSEDAKKLNEAIVAENVKREKANAQIDEEIAQLKDAAKIAEKEKTKKKPLGKLFYANRFLLEQTFPEEINQVSMIPVEGKDIGVEAIDDYTVRISLRQPAPSTLR